MPPHHSDANLRRWVSLKIEDLSEHPGYDLVAQFELLGFKVSLEIRPLEDQFVAEFRYVSAM